MTSDMKQLQRATAPYNSRMCAQHGAQRRAVDVRHLSEVENQFHAAVLNETLKGVVEDGRPIRERHPSADADQSDIGHEPGLDIHAFT